VRPRRWWRRLATGVALFAGLGAGSVAADFDPDPLRLGLVVALVVATWGLVLDSLADTGPSWTVEAAAHPARPPGQDARTARNLSLLENHVTARTADGALRDRLAALADLVLRQRHGVGREDPAAAALLGPDLTAVLDAPPRRLSRPEIERCVRRIEEL
jgi:hypothetical protein